MVGKLVRIFFIIMCVFQWSFTIAYDSVPLAQFSFGPKGRIVYDLDEGLMDVFNGDIKVIFEAHAEVINNGQALTSKDYERRSVSRETLKDEFGEGTLIKIKLSNHGLPDITQLFYTYPDVNYFFTEVILEGNSLSSNYMAPLVANKVNLGIEGDNRILFVPFDNDAFISYNAKPTSQNIDNTSSEVAAFYDNYTRTGFVAGSVEHSIWKTGVHSAGSGAVLNFFKVWGGYTDAKVTRDNNEHGALKGNHLKSPKIFIGFFDDWRNGLELYAQASAISNPRYVFDWNEPAPFGWNSWGAIQEDINLDKAKAVVDFFADSIPVFRNGGNAYIDLDSYWDKFIKGGLEGDFGQLKEFVNYCHNRGLKPGVYWAPFVDWIKENKRVEGSEYHYSEAWTKVSNGYHDFDGARAMDPTHPATQKRIDLLIKKFIDCGFEMIKVDFVGHAAIEANQFYDPSVKTGMQAFKKGMEYLIDRLDSRMFVYVAISPNLATGPYAHSRRIACDAYADIHATEYTLNSTSYGWWQSHLYNFIDADHLVLGNEPIHVNRARLTSGIINGTLIMGDDFSASGSWTKNARKLLQNEEILKVARIGKTFTPVEGNTGEGASELFIRQDGNDYYIAIINYHKDKLFKISLDRLGLANGTYKSIELYTGFRKDIKGDILEVEVKSKDAVILKLTSMKQLF